MWQRRRDARGEGSNQDGSIDAYLIEARSIGGLSGSPVFLHANDGASRTSPGLHVFGYMEPEFYLIGLMHGHFDAEIAPDDALLDISSGGGKINMGIGIVVPIEKVLEVIGQPAIHNREMAKIEALGKVTLPAVGDSL